MTLQSDCWKLALKLKIKLKMEYASRIGTARVGFLGFP